VVGWVLIGRTAPAWSTIVVMGGQLAGERPARGRQVATDMIRSLGLVAMVLLIWLYFAHPQTPDAVREVPWVPVAESAATRAPYEVVAPPESFAWPATSARIEPQVDGTVAWQVGFYTPDEDYAAIMQRGAFPEQAVQAQQDWIEAQTRNGVAGQTESVDGRDWTRLEGDPVPDDRRSLLLVEDGTVTIVTGSASWAELRRLAGALEPVEN
jgi:hypothetical protein